MCKHYDLSYKKLLTDGDLVEFEVLSQLDQVTLAREKLQADSELARIRYEHEKEIELAKIQLEREKANLQHKLSMEKGSTSNFNPHQAVKFVPAFQDDDIVKWFQVFDKAALSAKWPESSWVLLLQSRMKGKAQEAFAALPASEIGDYQNVKKRQLILVKQFRNSVSSNISVYLNEK